jgi:tRNA (guanine-N7-)-methyltransferase
MGSKNKLKRFNENDGFQNVIQPTRDEVINQFEHKGNWRNFFGNNNPIVVELGCGKGEYTIGLASQNPDKNYIGIDIKGARFWRGAKTAIENNYNNVAFVRTQIELVEHIFAANEINEIWITFPDPQIKYKRTKHRMTNPIFLEKYKKILIPKGLIHLKTDSEFMHGYTLGLLHGLGINVNYANHDIYKNEGAPKEVLNIKTFYEQQYLAKNKAITYLQFSL